MTVGLEVSTTRRYYRKRRDGQIVHLRQKDEQIGARAQMSARWGHRKEILESGDPIQMGGVTGC
jgi:hypothetical protein